MGALPAALRALASVPPALRPPVPTKAHLLDLLFPLRCAGCDAVGEMVCAACRAQVQPVPAPVCWRCGRPVAAAGRCAGCEAGAFTVSAIRAAAVYVEPLSQIIHRFKYEGRRELAEPLGALLAAYWQGRRVTADVAVAAPLHASRLEERGYNQSELLAAVLCQKVGMPLLRDGVLRRERATEQQALLGPQERWANVHGAFRWHGPPLQGVKVLLVDDVATTGATLEACGEALLAAGASKVWALTVARALGNQT